ncbi:hypothetical protein METUNv1_00128 [Methyloversatilis universalis FAM5]|uniref:Uncharacterized protein n=1 Tax=Methyloversatilis universalis (strain ATCC BAA-1314 / DSM 25237 / JCM 13912 / CCUG 52030 / FAM5) TaxID=1000565 RepID=F5R750_METUF|nr:hypothetical protein METUNv1_00128 [Methyloversatilis universalis FAM5]
MPSAGRPAGNPGRRLQSFPAAGDFVTQHRRRKLVTGPGRSGPHARIRDFSAIGSPATGLCLR